MLYGKLHHQIYSLWWQRVGRGGGPGDTFGSGLFSLKNKDQSLPKARKSTGGCTV
jgi:hypothetical protein